MRKAPLATIAVAATVLSAGIVQAAENGHVSFTACPLFRNTENSRCWLTDKGGVVYYIGRSETSPQLLHKVLVEGVISNEPRSCGGVVIRPVYISVLPELDYSCNTILPDNGDNPTEPLLYEKSTEQQLAADAPTPIPQAPFDDKKFVARFDYDSTFLGPSLQGAIETAGLYAIASKANHVRVVGHISGAKLDDGAILVERRDLAKVRAQTVAAALTAIGVDAARLDVSWLEDAPAPDGAHDAEKRVVDIDVTVPPAK